MTTLRTALRATTVFTTLMIAACGKDDGMRTPPLAPTPPAPPTVVTANLYVLPDAVKLGAMAFGDEALVIYKGERMHWVNLDAETHSLVADTPGATDFVKTGDLARGGEQSFIMTKLGTTTIHCTIHPGMVGTLIVREH